ncbi:MAG TPA: PASTA domain-containing protein [Paludibacter sp.]|nr:PASTA domain-containing protein [Paludibacter sp.]
MSYRQADAMLKAVGLSVGSVEYTPSEFKDLVTDVKYRGRSILPGTRVPEGSLLVLVVGNGLGESGAQVPALKGLTLEEAREDVLSASFVIGAINYDVQPSGNEEDYIIYRQSPSAGESIPTGSHIDIWLSTDKSLLNKTFDEDEKKDEGDEQFF